MLDFWENRYSAQEYAYGTEPNAYLAEILPSITAPGQMLFPADGEGRNGVYAASLGWTVTSFDQSEAGRTKALSLARKVGVDITYQVEDYRNIVLPSEAFDAIGLFYVHFPLAIKSEMHGKLIASLRPGGHVILEAFSKDHIQYQKLNPASGGPNDPGRFYAIEELQKDFQAFDILQLDQQTIDLKEGQYHDGRSSIVRFFARKKNR